MRTVAGIRIQDELGAGQELLQDEGVDRRDHDVIGAVDDEDGKPEALEVGVAGILGGVISGERSALGGDGLVGDGDVAVGAGGDAIDEGTLVRTVLFGIWLQFRESPGTGHR
jgi:hypothetical protein